MIKIELIVPTKEENWALSILFEMRGFKPGDRLIAIKKDTFEALNAAAQHVLGGFYDKLE